MVKVEWSLWATNIHGFFALALKPFCKLDIFSRQKVKENDDNDSVFLAESPEDNSEAKIRNVLKYFF